jgi:hypothetical protein
MEAKIKHLDFIQAAINRMASNSFLLKGWAVTIAGALLALTFKEINAQYIQISLAAVAGFWLLDSYYLSRERLFIKLYDHVRGLDVAAIDFSMDVSGFRRRRNWPQCCFSTTMVLFYGGLLLVHGIVLYSI